MTLLDKNNTPVQEGDYLKGCFGGYYQLQGDSLHLICEAGHPCEDIPYAFVPELFEKVLPSEVRAAPVVTYPTHQILDPQTGEPISHSLTISDLWVDVNSQAFYFVIASPGEESKDTPAALSYEQAATLRDFIDERLKTPL